MKKLFCAFLCLALAACLTNGKRGNEVSMAVYDLGAVAALPGAASALLPVAVEVRAPAWLDSMGIDYRLAYVDATRLREYSQARWAAPPAQLLQQKLIQGLALLATGQGRSSCLLRLDVSEFTQVFDTPEHSRGVFEGRVQLLDRARNRLAEQEIRIAKPAPSADSHGAVAALQAVSAQLTQDLQAWELAQLAGPGAAACGG